MTPLRAKMIRELELHRKSPETIEAYVTAVSQLAQYFGRSPEEIAVEEVRDFLHHLITQRHAAYSTVNQKMCGIRFLYRHVLERGDFQLRVPAKRSRRLPEPLARSEVEALFSAAPIPVPPQDLQSVAAAVEKQKQVPVQRIALEHFLDQRE